jgi:hypothetical protein
MVEVPMASVKYVHFPAKWCATRQKWRHLCRANCHLSFVFMHIPGGSSIFNIFMLDHPSAGVSRDASMIPLLAAIPKTSDIELPFSSLITHHCPSAFPARSSPHVTRY